MENVDKKQEPTSTENSAQNSNNTSEGTTSSSTGNLCIVCTTSKRAVALIPCGHYIACVPCGHGMATCPICRSEVMACVRIYE